MFVPLTISDFLRRAEQVYGARVGVIDEHLQPAPSLGELTYARVAALARAQAAGLDELGVGFGERVAIVSHNAARLMAAFFGVAGHGRVLVPVNFRLSAMEIAYIVEHSGATLLLVDPELDEPLRAVKCARRVVLGPDSDALLRFDRTPASWAADEGATATINYTSGTTARPKGVQLTHRNLWLNATTMALHAGVTDRDVYLHTLPMFHCNGWGMPFALAGLGVPQLVLR
jgi:fatty-acyl-CoA synthase